MYCTKSQTATGRTKQLPRVLYSASLDNGCGSGVPYSTYSLCSLCHSSSDAFGYSLKVFFSPSGRRTYAGAEPVMSTVYTDRQIPVSQSHIKKPQWKRARYATYHLFWHFELWLVDRRRGRVQKFWPVRIIHRDKRLCICQRSAYQKWVAVPSLIPEPEHRRALRTKVPLRQRPMFIRRAPIQHGFVYPVLPNMQSAISQTTVRKNHSYETSSFPLVTWSVCACAPRLIDPPAPPTLRQIEHTQS